MKFSIHIVFGLFLLYSGADYVGFLDGTWGQKGTMTIVLGSIFLLTGAWQTYLFFANQPKGKDKEQ